MINTRTVGKHVDQISVCWLVSDQNGAKNAARTPQLRFFQKKHFYLLARVVQYKKSVAQSLCDQSRCTYKGEHSVAVTLFTMRSNVEGKAFVVSLFLAAVVMTTKILLFLEAQVQLA